MGAGAAACATVSRSLALPATPSAPFPKSFRVSTATSRMVRGLQSERTMRLLPSAALLSATLALALLAGCDAGLEGDDAGSGGSGCEEAGCPEGQGGSGGGTGPRVGADEPRDAGDAANGATGASGSGGGDEGTGGGPLSEGALCESIQTGTDSVVLRVDDSNAFAAPLLVDALLEDWDGKSPLPARPTEFLNVYAPEVPVDGLAPGHAFDAGMVTVAAEGEQVFALQVAVRHIPEVASRPRSVALLIDTSPSVAPSLDRLLDAVDVVVQQLQPQDSLGVYSWSVDPVARQIRQVVPLGELALDPEVLRDAVTRAIDLGGANDLGASLVEALGQARAGGSAEGTVLLISDGSAGIDAKSLQTVRSFATDPEIPVRVVGIGVGPARGYSDDVIRAITDASGGASLYFDGSVAATDFLAERFVEMLDIGTRDVRLRLTMPPGLTLVATTGGETSEGSASGDVAGQNLAVGGTMTFHEYLRWDAGAVSCEGVAWSVIRGSGAEESTLGSGVIALADVLDARAETLATIEGSAVVAAAAAMQGPTPERMAVGMAAMRYAHTRITEMQLPWEGRPLASLCMSLQRACEKVGDACDTCPAAVTDDATDEVRP